jgi:chromate transport protein ChrA
MVYTHYRFDSYLGWDHAYTQMAWFFTKAALLTFGGAYAVLPYVYQGAVNFYGWLSPTQMIDGLALGESTPGPLIMVVAFVGFLGGFNHALLGVIIYFSRCLRCCHCYLVYVSIFFHFHSSWRSSD